MKEKAESAASDLQISSSSIVSSIISSLLGAEIVSDAPFRMNIFGIAGAWLDLLTIQSLAGEFSRTGDRNLLRRIEEISGEIIDLEAH